MPTQVAGSIRTKRTRAKKAAPSGASSARREGHLIGYARVSTTGQDTATQEARLKAAGCTLIRIETISGGSRNGRNELASILDFIRPGDVLIVVKLDRLGRNTRDVLNLVHELEEKGASLRVLEPASGGPMGRMVLTGLCRVAEMSLASSVIGNAPASTPRRRRAFTRVTLSLSTQRALSSRARKGCPNVQATGSTQPRGAPSPFVMLGVALPRRDDCGSRVLFPPLARDARQRRDNARALPRAILQGAGLMLTAGGRAGRTGSRRLSHAVS